VKRLKHEKYFKEENGGKIKLYSIYSKTSPLTEERKKISIKDQNR
jgi:hypothetical protein